MPGAYNQESIEAHFRNTNQPYEQPLAEIPQDVIDMAQSGKTLEAIKRYRELTNASADRAKQVVQGPLSDEDLLRRVYRAFAAIDSRVEPTAFSTHAQSPAT